MEDSAGHDRTVLDARSGSVPLYHPLGSGTAVHLSLRESDFSFQFLFQTLDSSFGFSHFFSTITDAVAFRQQTLQLVQSDALQSVRLRAMLYSLGLRRLMTVSMMSSLALVPR